MHELEVAWRELGELIPYARNPRTHSDAQVAQIAASIREFGWTTPVLVDGGSGIIAGHGRVLAARKLGLERVPVIELAHMTDAQKLSIGVGTGPRIGVQTGPPWPSSVERAVPGVHREGPAAGASAIRC